MNFELMLRLMILLLLGSIFLISGLYRRRARTEEFIKRQEEGYLALVLRMAAAIPLFLVIILDIFFPELMGWSKFNIPNWLRIVGMSLALGSVLWLWWVFRTIGSNISETVLTKDTHELVTIGPYRWIRHPLYAGALLLLISIGLALEDFFILSYAVIGILAFRLLVIPVEEEALLEAFGEDYECYQSRTGAMLPWFR
jgi:protein-S-isoprenylcysteine O-methyltransferase Ste14